MGQRLLVANCSVGPDVLGTGDHTALRGVCGARRPGPAQEESDPAHHGARLVLLLTLSRRSIFFLLILKRNASMADKPSDLIQGTLDMLILKTLALESMHGYGIAVRLEQMSKGVFRLNAGSLFVAFQRLQRAGLIKGEWKATENSRRAKYYVLTNQGRKKLNSETREWGRQVAAIAGILEAS